MANRPNTDFCSPGPESTVASSQAISVGASSSESRQDRGSSCLGVMTSPSNPINIMAMKSSGERGESIKKRAVRPARPRCSSGWIFGCCGVGFMGSSELIYVWYQTRRTSPRQHPGPDCAGSARPHSIPKARWYNHLRVFHPPGSI